MALRKGTNLNDIFKTGAGAEQFDGLLGYDIVSYAASATKVGIDLLNAARNTGAAKGDTFTSIEAFKLTAFDDTFAGSNGVESVNGGVGNDVINGRGGNDQLTGHSGNDTLNGGAGNDGLWGGGGDDTIFGGDGADNANGDSGNDRINGGIGNDRINGGSDGGTVSAMSGTVVSLTIGDTLTGGAGADTFVFANGGGVDMITDFAARVDRIDVANIWFDGNAANGEFKVIDHVNGAVIVFTDSSADGLVDNMAIQLAGIAAANVHASIFI